MPGPLSLPEEYHLSPKTCFFRRLQRCLEPDRKETIVGTGLEHTQVKRVTDEAHSHVR
jgi:hypothetical protein